MSAMVKRTRLAATLAALLATVVLAGCAAGTSPRASAARPAGSRTDTTTSVAARTGTGSGSGSASASCNPYAVSLRPQPGPPSLAASPWAQQIRHRGYLIAGVDQSTYHFGYLNPITRQITGFDIDIVKAVAAAIFGMPPDDPALAAHIHFKAISDAQRIPDVQSGAVDIVAHTMTINCMRAQLVDFSTVYFDAKQQVLVLKPADGSRPPDLQQLGARHEKVCATAGSDSVDHIHLAGAIPVQVAYWTDCLVLLQEGQVAGISTDNSILAGMKAQDPFTVITGPSLEDEPYGLAMSKAHPDFVRFVNAVLAQQQVDQPGGPWAASYATWVGGTLPHPWPIGYAG